MNKKELVYQALQHKSADRIPCWINAQPQVEAKLRGHFKTDNLDLALGNYIINRRIGEPADFTPTRLAEDVPDEQYGYLRTEDDEYGGIWCRQGPLIGYLTEPPLPEPTLEGYTYPDPYAPGRFHGMQEVIDDHPDHFITLFNSRTLVERMHFLRGYENALMDFIAHPKFLQELLETIMRFNMGIIDQVNRYDVDAFWFGDDWGDQRGITIGADRWRKFLKPHYRKLCDAAKANGRHLFLHSDGNLTELMPDIIELGIDAIHPCQPEVMDLKALKREYGAHITFFGGIDTQQVLPFATPREVKAHVLQCLRTLGEGGGMILAPGICMQEDVPWENVLTFIEVAQTQSL